MLSRFILRRLFHLVQFSREQAKWPFCCDFLFDFSLFFHSFFSLLLFLFLLHHSVSTWGHVKMRSDQRHQYKSHVHWERWNEINFSRMFGIAWQIIRTCFCYSLSHPRAALLLPLPLPLSVAVCAFGLWFCFSRLLFCRWHHPSQSSTFCSLMTAEALNWTGFSWRRTTFWAPSEKEWREKNHRH